MKCRVLIDFEKALFSPQFTSPTAGWRAYANETSFADWWIAAELIKNAKHSYHGGDLLMKVWLQPGNSISYLGMSSARENMPCKAGNGGTGWQRCIRKEG